MTASQPDEPRPCEQCGTRFTPRREHARFCSARCRLAWNRENSRYATVSAAALDWSLSAMTEAAARLAGAGSTCGHLADQAHATAAVGDAVWLVTIVDATLIRYRPADYEATLGAQSAADRAEIEQTLAGLRYVRNQMGVHLDPAEFISPDADRMGWTWRTLPEPATGPLSPRGREWELTRYRAYSEWLAGRDVAGTFALASGFLRAAAAASASRAGSL